MLINLSSKRNRKNERLLRVLKNINSSTSAKELFHTALNQILDFMGAERGSILVFDAENKELTLKIARGQEETLNNLPNLRQKIGEGISGLVAQERKPLLVKNINKDLRLKNRHNRINHYRTKSFLSMPIFTRGSLIGVINVTDKFSGKLFCEEDLSDLSIISSQVSYMLEMLRLCDDTIKQKDKIDKLNSDLNELNKELGFTKKFASLGKISSGIAHEINNPLDGVLRYTNLCLMRAKEEDQSKEYLKEIKTGLNRIADIVRSLLEFSRHNTNEKKLLDIHETIDEIIVSINKTRDINNIAVVKKYSPDTLLLPDKGIKHVFFNLIKNAYDAMNEAAGTLTISTERKNNHLELRVSDTGCGIPEEHRMRVFEPFFSTKNKENGGAGLGLAICYDIIERYSGKIAVESYVNKGTTFTVSIPYTDTN